MQAFQDEYRLSFPIVLDLDQSVYQTYQTMGVPESLLIDQEGRIIERYVGRGSGMRRSMSSESAS